MLSCVSLHNFSIDEGFKILRLDCRFLFGKEVYSSNSSLLNKSAHCWAPIARSIIFRGGLSQVTGVTTSGDAISGITASEALLLASLFPLVILTGATSTLYALDTHTGS